MDLFYKITAVEHLNSYISHKYKSLLNSNRDFEAIFNHIHNQGNRIFCEYFDLCCKKSVSYDYFKKYCYKAGKYIKDKINYDKGEYVGLYLENSTNWIACFWGLLMIGVKPVLLNCKMPVDMTNEIINLLSIKTVLCGNSLENHELKASKLVVSDEIQIWDDISNYDPLDTFSWENEIALVTTATSLNYKICIYTGNEIAYQIFNSKGILKENKIIKAHYKGRLKLLTFLPLYHVFGLIAMYFWFSTYGRTFVFLENYSGETILKTVKSFEVTHIFGVPLLWNTLSREIFKQVNRLPPKDKKKFDNGVKKSLSYQNAFPTSGMKKARKGFKLITEKTLGNSIKFLITGGGYISEDTLKLFNALGYPLCIGYGTTEIGITSVELRIKPKDRIKGSIGRPFDNVGYKILNGELYFKGPTSCYKIIYRDGREELLNHNEWYETNDCASVDKNGYYFISGRADDVFVNSNGEKVNLDLIEKKLFFTTTNSYSLIDRSINGKIKLNLIIQIGKNPNDLVLAKINKEVSDNISRINEFGYPVDVYYTYNAIANKNSIKVSRKYLKLKLDSNEIKLINFNDVAVESEKKTNDEIFNNTLQTIKKCIAEVLDKNIDQISDSGHFIFDLGGSSLDYVTLLVKLENEFSISFNFKEDSCSSAIEFAKYILNIEKGDSKNEKI